MTTDTTPQDVIGAILDGTMDEHMDELLDAYKARRNTVRNNKAQLNALTLKPGARVRLVNLSPKYLSGLTGEIVEPIERTQRRGKPRFDVKVDSMPPQGTRRFYNNTVHGVPASAIEAIA